MTPMTKTAVVMDRDNVTATTVTYVWTDDVDNLARPRRVLTLDASIWDALGCPRQVTVTVESGDVLAGGVHG